MRLPQQQRKGVQSLGRRDPGRPLAVANRRAGQVVQEGQANRKLAQERGAIAMRAASDINTFALKLSELENQQGYFEQVMNFETKAKKSMQELTKNNMVDLNSIEIPENARGVTEGYREETLEDGTVVRMAPTHEVGDAIHEARLREYIDIGDQQLRSDKVKDEYRRAIRGTYSNSSEAVFAKGTVDRVNIAKAKADENYDKAIALKDVTRANEIAASAVATGAWSQDQYVQNMRTLLPEIDVKHFVGEITQAKNSDDLQDIIGVLNDGPNNLTGPQQLSLIKEAESRMSKMENDTMVTVEVDKVSQKAWALQKVDEGRMNIHNLYTSGISPDVIPSIRTAIQQRDTEGYQYSDPRTVGMFQTKIAALQFPSAGEDVSEMAMKAKQDLFLSMSGKQLGYSQYKKMVAEVDKSSKAGYNTQEYKTAMKSIELEILNMPQKEADLAKKQAEWTGNSEQVAAFERKGVMQARAIQDLQMYIRGSGAMAKPDEWWANNKDNYTPEAFEMEATQQFQRGYPEYAVGDSTGKFDEKATVRNMVKQVNTGKISDKQYDTMYRTLKGKNIVDNTRTGAMQYAPEAAEEIDSQ